MKSEQVYTWCMVGFARDNSFYDNPDNRDQVKDCDEAADKMSQLGLGFKDELQDLREKCED